MLGMVGEWGLAAVLKVEAQDGPDLFTPGQVITVSGEPLKTFVFTFRS